MTFDKALYDKVDGPAKAALSAVLKTKDYEIINGAGDELYNTDVVAQKPGGPIVRFECSVKNKRYFDGIVSGYYRNIWIPLRKIINKNISDWYVFFPDTYNEMLMISATVVKNSPTRIVENQHKQKEETISVDRKQAIRYRINPDNTADNLGKLV